MPDGVFFVFEQDWTDFIDQVTKSINLLQNNLHEPFKKIMESYEDYAEDAFKSENPKGLNQPWPALSQATLEWRAARKGYYQRQGIGGAYPGQWTMGMRRSLNRIRGQNAIRKPLMGRHGVRGILYGTSLQRAVYFHHGTTRGGKPYGFGGQPARPIIPLAPGQYPGTYAIQGSPASQIAYAVFNNWLGRRIPVFRLSTGAIVQGTP